VRLALALLACSTPSFGQLFVAVTAVSQDGITTSNPIDNRSAVIRHSTVHTFCATGTGSWTAQIQYSDTNNAGSYLNYSDSTSLVTNNSSSCVGVAIGYHNYIRFLLSGSTTISYRGVKDIYVPSNTSGGASGFPNLGGGTNNSGTFVCTTGCSFGFSASGIVNANQLKGIALTNITSLTGNGSKLATSTGSLNSGDAAQIDAAGNFITSGLQIANIIRSTATYSDPSWLTGLAASKLIGTVSSTQGGFGQSMAAFTGVVYLNSGVPAAVAGSASNCVLVNGTSGSCGGASAPSGTGCTAAASNAFTATRTLTVDTTMTIDFPDCTGNPVFHVRTDTMLSRATDQAGTDRYCRSTTGNDTATCSLTPTLTTYTPGACFGFNKSTANAGSVTLAVDSQSALSILRRDGSALSANDIPANITIPICLNSTAAAFELGYGTSNGIALISSGSTALGTGAISSAACATVVTATATGVLSTDAISWNPNGSIKAVTGYVPSTSGGLSIAAYPGSGTVNFDVCNWTSGTITPGAITINWSVSRHL
jgi:hypothetical protein